MRFSNLIVTVLSCLAMSGMPFAAQNDKFGRTTGIGCALESSVITCDLTNDIGCGWDAGRQPNVGKAL